MSRPVPERVILAGIINVLGRRPDVRIFRNGQAFAIDRHGRAFRGGLGEGTADLVGILAPGGWFLAIEVKSATGRPTEGQLGFLDTVQRFGGCALLVRSVEDAVAGVDAFLSSHASRAVQPGESHARASQAQRP